MASKQHGGLGKGLGALLKDTKLTPARDKVQEIAISEIQANRYQPRQEFDESALEDLKESVQRIGVIQPILVRRLPGTGYELIAGERRLRASKLAGLKSVPAMIREYNDAEISEIALIENIQREDLNAIEEARAYARLMKDFGLTQDIMAKKIGRSRSHIANFLRLLKLEDQVQEYVANGTLSMGQAKPLLAGALGTGAGAGVELPACDLGATTVRVGAVAVPRLPPDWPSHRRWPSRSVNARARVTPSR